MVFWSLSFIWYKIAYLSFGPVSVIFFRLIISTVFLILISFAIKKFQRIEKKDVKYFFLLAFFEPFIYFIGESYGIKYVSSTLASVIVSTIPLFTPIMAYYVYKEKFTWFNFMGIFLSMIGILLIVLNNNTEKPAYLKGVGLMFIAVLGAVGYSFFVKKLVNKYNPFMLVCYQNLFGMGLFMPLFFIIEYKSFQINAIETRPLFAIIQLALFASSLAFVLFTFSVRRIGISKATALVNVIPVFTAIFAYFIIQEPLSVIKFVGIFIVIAGLLLSQMRRHIKKELILDDGQNISGEY